jgi:hypothetical protein
MFTIPFFCPYVFSLQAYKSTRFEVPIVSISNFLEERFCKGTKEYEEAIKKLPGNHIKEELQSFFDDMGIRKDLIVAESRNLGFCSSQGTNFFTKGDAVIWVTPRFQREDKDACHWVMKHEISHIKNNDCFTIPLVSAICSIAAATFSTFLMPVTPALLVTNSIGFITQAIFSQYREGKADDLAIAKSSSDELKGGRRLLMALKEANLKKRNTMLNKIVISSTGENRLDFFHPSTASRLRKIEHALQQQDIEINDDEESEKIIKLKKLMEKTHSQLKNELEKLGTLGLLLAMLIK